MGKTAQEVVCSTQENDPSGAKVRKGYWPMSEGTHFAGAHAVDHVTDIHVERGHKVREEAITRHACVQELGEALRTRQWLVAGVFQERDRRITEQTAQFLDVVVFANIALEHVDSRDEPPEHLLGDVPVGNLRRDLAC